MKKILKKVRRVCRYCGARRYDEMMYLGGGGNLRYWTCKNNDLCVLKMGYIKKVKKLKHEK